MTTTWKTVPVFISSTFRHMHAEEAEEARCLSPCGVVRGCGAGRC